MYHYFSLLYNKYRNPILPIAVFSYNKKKNELNQFTVGFPFFHVLKFNFLMLELRKMNWRAYIKSDNPVAAALLSKMGYAFFETYLKLNEEEEGELVEQIKQSDHSDEISELPNSWEEKGVRKGIEEGKEVGKLEEKRNIAMELLREGSSTEFVEKVTHLTKKEIEDLKKRL